MLGPIDVPWHGDGYFPDKEAQKGFDIDKIEFGQFGPTVDIDGRDYAWAVLESDHGVVDRTRAFDRWYVIAYKKGRNQLVLKILGYGRPWGFACRLLETKPVDQ